MENYIIIAMILLILGGACFYIRREKKKGAKCIGCPYAKQCGSNCAGACTQQPQEKN